MQNFTLRLSPTCVLFLILCVLFLMSEIKLIDIKVMYVGLLLGQIEIEMYFNRGR